MIMKAAQAAKLSQQFKNKKSLTNEHVTFEKQLIKRRMEMKTSNFYYFMFLNKMEFYVF